MRSLLLACMTMAGLAGICGATNVGWDRFKRAADTRAVTAVEGRSGVHAGARAGARVDEPSAAANAYYVGGTASVVWGLTIAVLLGQAYRKSRVLWRAVAATVALSVGNAALAADLDRVAVASAVAAVLAAGFALAAHAVWLRRARLRAFTPASPTGPAYLARSARSAHPSSIG